jgi:ubiquinone/menaquinone biosynthesis C-methylase UbiE
MKAVSKERWEESQRHELAFWKSWTELEPYRNLDLPNYWSQELIHLGCTPEIFAGRRVADVGCGPHGLIHYIDGAAERIRVDPLLPQYVSRTTLPGPQLSLAAMGESLPLASASIDVIICFNALDHMRNPSAVLGEFHRVLRPQGKLLLMVHTFPAWARAGFWIDRLHPHHWTAHGFTGQVARFFTIERSRTVHRSFEIPPSKWLHPSSWKYMAASLVLNITYVTGTSDSEPRP